MGSQVLFIIKVILTHFEAIIQVPHCQKGVRQATYPPTRVLHFHCSLKQIRFNFDFGIPIN